MKQIVMQKTEKGSIDGITVRLYEAGKKYELPDSLADVFLDVMKIAKLYQPNMETPEGGAAAMETPEQPKKRGKKA
jgi:hypothetical protein